MERLFQGTAIRDLYMKQQLQRLKLYHRVEWPDTYAYQQAQYYRGLFKHERSIKAPQ